MALTINRQHLALPEQQERAFQMTGRCALPKVKISGRRSYLMVLQSCACLLPLMFPFGKAVKKKQICGGPEWDSVVKSQTGSQI